MIYVRSRTFLLANVGDAHRNVELGFRDRSAPAQSPGPGRQLAAVRRGHQMSDSIDPLVSKLFLMVNSTKIVPVCCVLLCRREVAGRVLGDVAMAG
jgi:hypothetical protein